MASRPTHYRPSRRSSPQPPVASGSGSWNQEPMERRPPGSRGHSRSRSPPHQRWASDPTGRLYAPPISHHGPHFEMRSHTPSRQGRQHPALYEQDDRRDHGRGESEVRGRDNLHPTTSGQQAPESEHNWKTRARSSPPAETMRTGRESRSLLPEEYNPPQGGPDGRNPYAWGGGMGMGHAPSGQRSSSAILPRNLDWDCSRSRSSDASTRHASPPFPQQANTGRRGLGGGQEHIPSWPHGQYANQTREGPHLQRDGVQGRLVENSWNYPPPRDDAALPLDRGPPVHNYGTTNNIGNAGNVLAGIHYGNVYMESVTVGSTDEFMVNLADRLKICARADHMYYAPSEEAALRRGQCTPGTRISVIDGVTVWAVDLSPSSESVYWLSGQAGAGKTTIAYTIARLLESGVGGGNGRVILGASFFCSRQFPDTRSASSIVRTIVYRLALRSKPFQVALKEYGRFETVDHGPKSQLMGLLIEPWEMCAPERQAHNEPCYVISIDALDELEAEGGSEFLAVLFDVLEQHGLSGLKFFVTSRSHPTLVKRIKSFKNKQVCRLEEVPLNESSADIKLYLSRNLGECASECQIQQLVADAAGLFIHAATVVEYLQGRDLGEQKILLERLVAHSSSPAYRPSRGATATLDTLYRQILDTCLVDQRDRDDPDVFQDCLSILHTFLCTIERTSTCVAVDILNPTRGMDLIILETGTADAVLHRLHAVLYSQEGQVMWFHKSFVDFLFDESRSQKFFCNQEQHHGRLASSCFGIMAKQLRFNIADVSSSYQLDCDNPALAASIESNVSRPLRYACTNWSAHLLLASKEVSDDLAETLNEFLQLRILFWIEAMNLLGQRGRCHGMLRDTRRFVSLSKERADLVSKSADAAAFAVHHCMSKASLSTPHLYVSSLATFNRHSELVQHWRCQFGGIPGFISVEGVGVESLVASIQVGHKVDALAISPNGINVVVGSPHGLVRVWDLSTGEEVRVLRGHSLEVNAVAYCPDGTFVVSGSDDASVRVWDLSTEAVRIFKGHTGKVTSVAFSPDGIHVVSGSSDKSVRVWNKSTGEERRVLKGHDGWVWAVACSPDGIHIASASWDNSIRVWELSTGVLARVLNGHTGSVQAVAFSPDGTSIVSGSGDKSVRVWDMDTGEETKVFKGHTDTVYAVAYSPDGTHVASSSSDRSVRVWDLSSGKEVRVLEAHTNSVEAVAYYHDGTHVVTGSYDNSIGVWDVLAGEDTKVSKSQAESVRAVAFSPDGTHIVSCLPDGSVWAWDLSSGQKRRMLDGYIGFVGEVVYSPDGTHIVALHDESARVRNLSTGEEVMVIQGDFIRAAYFPHGTHVVVSSTSSIIQAWDLSTGGQVRQIRDHNTVSVTPLACSPDGTNVVSGSRDVARVWDLSTGKELRALNGHHLRVSAVAYSPDGTRVISGASLGSLRVWNPSTGEVVRDLKGHINSIETVAYSPGSTQAASGSSDKTIRVWDISTGEAVKVLEGHTNEVKTVAYSPNGSHIVSTSLDKSVRVWNISPEFSPRFIRQKNKDGKHTGWLLSPTDPSVHLMFVSPEALLPDDSNTHTFPKYDISHVDFSNAKLGYRWAECYNPTSS